TRNLRHATGSHAPPRLAGRPCRRTARPGRRTDPTGRCLPCHRLRSESILITRKGPAMFAIARSEFRQIVRNRAVLITTLIIPLASSAYFIFNRDMFENFDGNGYLGAILVFTIGVFSLYSGMVTILAARRQNLFLKRLRSAAAGDPALLAGLVTPISLISLLQVMLVLGVFAAVTTTPESLALLMLAIGATFAMALALGMATAGLTSSPEQ